MIKRKPELYMDKYEVKTRAAVNDINRHQCFDTLQQSNNYNYNN